MRFFLGEIVPVEAVHPELLSDWAISSILHFCSVVC